MRKILSVMAVISILLFVSCGTDFEKTPVESDSVNSSQINDESLTAQTDISIPISTAASFVTETQTSVETVKETVGVTEDKISDGENEISAEVFKLSFVAAGDNMIYYGNVRDAAKNAEGTGKKYDFRPSYSTVKPVIEKYDLAFINQETLMCGDGYELSYYPRFNSPREVGEAIIDAGFDIVGLANNHMLDKGEKGLLATLDYWERQPVTITGAYRNRDEFEKITVIKRNGIKIALLSFAEHTNGLALGKGSEVFVPYIDNELVAKKVSEAEKIADVTIISIHWGDENTFNLSKVQKETAKVISENGGDVIIGHHPHIIQAIEWVETDNNRTLCAYSLGNFMSEMASGYNLLGGLLSFDIKKQGEETIVENVLFTPTVFDYDTKFYNNHIFFLEDYTDEQARAHGIRYYGNSTTLKKLYGYVTDNIDDEFLPEFLKAE